MTDVPPELLHRLGRLCVEQIRRAIDQESWKKPPLSIKQSISYTIQNGDVQATYNYMPTVYQNYGVRPHTMLYLVRARRPIALRGYSGSTIFRWATLRSISRGHWRHPGIRPKYFIQKGKEMFRQSARQLIIDFYRAEARKEAGRPQNF